MRRQLVGCGLAALVLALTACGGDPVAGSTEVLPAPVTTPVVATPTLTPTATLAVPSSPSPASTSPTATNPTTTTATPTRPTSSATVTPTTTKPRATPSRTKPTATPKPTETGIQLPRGGRTLFPRYRLVGFSGAPGSTAFGRLGIGDLDARGREIEKMGESYTSGRRVMPVFELIATVATADAGRDGQYRKRTDDATIQRYLDAARRARALLLLNIQPGRADFLPEVQAYEKWLREPDVGLALDPEWAVGPGQVPGRVFGSTTGKELDAVASYVAGIVAAGRLPEKAIVFHQVAGPVVKDQAQLKAHAGVVLVKSVDGIGSKAMKTATWRKLTSNLPSHIHAGFKLFFEEDVERGGRIMSPSEVLALRPEPEYVLYE